nr:hypothetical protein [Nonlabens sp. Ci31]
MQLFCFVFQTWVEGIDLLRNYFLFVAGLAFAKARPANYSF